MYNNDISYKDIGELGKERNIDIMFLSNYRLLEFFGVKCDPISYINRFETKHSFLIIIDKDKVVKKIYQDATDDDILAILNEI